MEFCWNFVFQISQFFDKISYPYNKSTQKVWIGERGKKDY